MKDDYSAVSESMSSLSDRIGIMTHPLLQPERCGTYQIAVQLNAFTAEVSCYDAQLNRSTAKALFPENRMMCRTDTGWGLQPLKILK
ncbi:MAG: hypothetical protein AB8B86_09960 [Pseudomonadales bacterium]